MKYRDPANHGACLSGFEDFVSRRDSDSTESKSKESAEVHYPPLRSHTQQIKAKIQFFPPEDEKCPGMREVLRRNVRTVHTQPVITQQKMVIFIHDLLYSYISPETTAAAAPVSLNASFITGQNAARASAHPGEECDARTTQILRAWHAFTAACEHVQHVHRRVEHDKQFFK